MSKSAKIAFLICLFIAVGSVVALRADFRGVEWGATLLDVDNTETWERVTTKDDYTGYADWLDIYLGEIAGYTCKAIYMFEDIELDSGGIVESLVAGMYIFDDTDPDVYTRMEVLLDRKYGEPTTWQLYEKEWKHGDTIIGITWDNYTIILYADALWATRATNEMDDKDSEGL